LSFNPLGGRYVLRKRQQSYHCSMWVMTHGKIHAQRLQYRNFPKIHDPATLPSMHFGQLRSADPGEIPSVGKSFSVSGQKTLSLYFRKSFFRSLTVLGLGNAGLRSSQRRPKTKAWAKVGKTRIGNFKLIASHSSGFDDFAYLVQSFCERVDLSQCMLHF